MNIAEPMTMITDYALAGVTAWLGLRLATAREGQVSRLSWALAFAALAFAAALGGTYHGFAPHLSESALHLLWKATLLAAGIASFSTLAGSATAMTTGGLRTFLVAFAVIKLVLYSAWMLGHSDFVYVIADTGASMAVMGALHACSVIREGDRASWLMLAGVAISAIAAAVQASGFALHRHFNHNDLYHVIQIVAMMYFYGGARRLLDRKG